LGGNSFWDFDVPLCRLPQLIIKSEKIKKVIFLIMAKLFSQ